MGYSCRTLLRDTLVRHSSGTLLRDTLVGLSSSSPDTPRTKVVLQGCQFSASSSPDTPRTTVVLQGRQFSASSSTDCSASSSCTTKSPVLSFQLHRLLRVLKLYYQVTSSHLPAIQIPRVLKLYKVACARLHFARSTRTISAEGCVGTGQIALSPAFRALDTHDLRRGLRAHGTNRTLACISHTRHARSPQRVARQVSKTSVSYENSSKAHTSKSAKRAKSSGNTHRSTHITQPCQAVSRFQPLQTTSAHTPIPMGQRHSPLPQLTTSRFPAPATNLSPSTRLTRTKYCACHEMSPPSHLATSRFPAPATRIALPRFKEVLRLPRKVTISSHVSFNKICTTPHVWNDFDPFRAHSHPPKSPFQLRLVTKTELRCHTLKRKSQWHGHTQHPKNTTLQTLIPMALRSKLRISQNAAPVQRNASRFLRDMSVSCQSQWNCGAN